MAMKERDALDMLRTAMVASVSAEAPDLTARQLAILLVVALEPGPHTVRSLATRLNLSKPVITRAVDALSRQDFVRRLPDENDLRSVFIERTAHGMTHLRGHVSGLVAPVPAAGRPGKPARPRRVAHTNAGNRAA